jgi:FkbM family methyltransferase
VNLPAALNKPEYCFRPSQIIAKVRYLTRRHRADGLLPVRLPWDDILYASATDAIGKSLLTFGVYELAVSEVLWRLVDVGDTCLDIGANIGYMTSLLATRAGGIGRVFCYEPHPKIFGRLKRNLELFAYKSNVVACENAIGAEDGEAELVEPGDFKNNEGTASISPSFSRSGLTHVKHGVTVRSLDSIFSNAEAPEALKIDVEGAELDVFRGAEHLLSGRKIRDIVWEDHKMFPSEPVKLLSRHGYSVYQFAKRLLGPVIWDPFAGQAKPQGLPWESINFLATLEPIRAVSRLSTRGWHCLRSS